MSPLQQEREERPEREMRKLLAPEDEVRMERRRERAGQEAKQATLEADVLTTARTAQGISGA